MSDECHSEALQGRMITYQRTRWLVHSLKALISHLVPPSYTCLCGSSSWLLSLAPLDRVMRTAAPSPAGLFLLMVVVAPVTAAPAALFGTAVGRVSGEMGRPVRPLRVLASPGEQLAIGPSQTPLFHQDGKAVARLPPPGAHPRGFLDNLLQLLHLLGYTDEEIIQWIGDLATDVEYLLSQLPPRDIMAVEVAAGDILGMIQDGELDPMRLQLDLLIIHDILWPDVDSN